MITALKEQAKKRDIFIGNLKRVTDLLKKNHFLESKNHLEKLVKNYAAPDYDLPDLELAQTLKQIDDDFSQNQEWQDFFSFFGKNLCSISNLPNWAVLYLENICSPPQKSNGHRRKLLLESIWKQNKESKEAGFLLATILTQEGVDKTIQKKFEEAIILFEKALGVFSIINKTLPPPQPIIPIFRIVSLFSTTPHDVLEQFKIWLLENYVYVLQEQRYIEKAIELLNSQPNLHNSLSLISLMRNLEMEKRIRDDLNLKQSNTWFKKIKNKLRFFKKDNI